MKNISQDIVDFCLFPLRIGLTKDIRINTGARTRAKLDVEIDVEVYHNITAPIIIQIKNNIIQETLPHRTNK